MFLHKGLIHQIRWCLCARDGREPCRTMQNHADRWGLSHLEPPKSQPTLVELRSSQIGAPTCFLVRIIDQIRYVAGVHGMAGNHADRWGLFALRTSWITTYSDRIFPDWSANMFLDKGLIDQIRHVAYVHGMAGNKADRWGLSHLEPPKSQPTLESKSGWCANMFLDKGFIDQIRCCLCAWDGREPCRTMQNHADRWGLSHLEPPESQTTLVQSS